MHKREVHKSWCNSKWSNSHPAAVWAKTGSDFAWSTGAQMQKVLFSLSTSHTRKV